MDCRHYLRLCTRTIGVVDPAFWAHGVVHDHKLNDVLQAFQAANDVCAMGPRASEIDVQNIAVFLRWEVSTGSG